MKMKRFFAIVLALALTMSVSYELKAQMFGGPDFMRGKAVVGGNAKLGLAHRNFYAGVSPQIGYRLTRSLEIGARLGYDLNYYFGTQYATASYFTHFFSGAVYVNCDIFNGFYVHVEDEEMCRLVSGHAVETSYSRWFNSIFVGGGYHQYLSEKSFTFYSILYNLSWGLGLNGYQESPYATPFVIRVGFCTTL